MISKCEKSLNEPMPFDIVELQDEYLDDHLKDIAALNEIIEKLKAFNEETEDIFADTA